MNARACHFADCEKSLDGSLTLKIGRNASAAIVRRGNDGHGLARDIDAQPLAMLIDARKTCLDPIGRLVGDVEENT